jgi:hypothetical protein
MSIEVIQSNGKTYQPSVADIEVACKYPMTELIRYFRTIRLLLLAGFCLLITVGCATQHDLVGLKMSLRSTDELIVLKQSETVGMLSEQTTALAAIIATLKVIELNSETDSGREVINLDNEQQPLEDANDSHSAQHQADSVAVVRLLVSSTAGCAPCAKLWRDVDAGLFEGFAVEKSGDFDGLKSYPAIRYEDASSATGWAVVYGYDAAQLRLLKKKLLPTKAAYRTAFWTHDEMVAKHNEMHGGGSWSWPGDLARHLATVHGVETNGMDQANAQNPITGKQYAIRSVSRGIFGRVRSRNSYRQSCPAGGCP